MSKFPDAVITIEGNDYALYSKSGHENPHMIELSTGEIPFGDQRSLLKKYLLKQGIDIEPWEKRNTHWCIHKAIKDAKKGI